jgi:hypothetical protein
VVNDFEAAHFSYSSNGYHGGLLKNVSEMPRRLGFVDAFVYRVRWMICAIDLLFSICAILSKIAKFSFTVAFRQPKPQKKQAST